ncbi:MAG: polyphosphate polymerase domain-containing protein [Tenericutes bacterium]|nr:polyphosphate polymerase domain-containing protein [Mycoplasmatota bacterium]
MDTRVELKFMINYEDYKHLNRQLNLIMDTDPNITRDNGYNLSSLYFDDMYDSATHDKAGGTEFHKKFRIRTYENGKKQLEYKTKNGNLTSKDTLPLTDELEEALIKRNYDVIRDNLDKELLKQIFIKMKMNDLKPRLYIDYFREVYIFHNSDVRITFDKDITAYNCYNKYNKYKILEPRTIILEVKYTKSIPEAIRKIVFSRNFQTVPYSKYLMGWLKLTNWGV